MANTDILMSYVPNFISKSNVFSNIYNSQGKELDVLGSDLVDLQNQCFIDTATWSLDMWEQFLDIKTDTSKSYADRQSVVKSKIRGIGTVTVTMMKNVANSFQNGEVDVIEHSEKYSFEVKFVSTKGIPPNLQDLKNAIELIKPAHLDVSYSFTYNTWQQISNLTWLIASNYTWDLIRLVNTQIPIVDDITNLSATTGDGHIKLTWNNPVTSSTITILRKERSAPTGYDDAAATVIASGNLINSYTDTAATDITQYFYYVFLVDKSGKAKENLNNIISIIPQDIELSGLKIGETLDDSKIEAKLNIDTAQQNTLYTPIDSTQTLNIDSSATESLEDKISTSSSFTLN